MQSVQVNDLHTGTEAETAATVFTVALSLNIEDVGKLWAAAAERALAAPGMTLADVLDTIGPREDPAIAECLAMLLPPPRIAGCTVEEMEIHRPGSPASVDSAGIVAWPVEHAPIRAG